MITQCANAELRTPITNIATDKLDWKVSDEGRAFASHIGERFADPSTEILLQPGAFYKIPAGLTHISQCNIGEDCLTFLSPDGKFNFLQTAQ